MRRSSSLQEPELEGERERERDCTHHGRDETMFARYADGAGLLSEATMETLKDLPVKNLIVSVSHFLLAVVPSID